MNVVQIFEETPGSSRMVELAMKSCALARSAATKAADGIASRNALLLKTIDDEEKELDRIDREMDEAVVFAITETTVREARELLACMKFVIDLERIGDLICSFSCRAVAILPRLADDDIRDFVRMATSLEQMLANAEKAFRERDINLAIKVLKADTEIDRLRNLVFIRHVENHDHESHQESIQVLFMAQELERAGDHVKNLGEEVCHFVTGRTVRHVMRSQDRSYEQLFIDWLREKHKAHP